MGIDDGVRIGIISDTHGIFRSKIVEVFDGVDHIVHAGDIGRPLVLRELEKIAPVTAVLGNTDIPSWFPELQNTALVEIAGKKIMVLHILDELDTDPAAARIDAVIYGHTHKPHARKRGNVWYINPGSAGPHRFLSPVSVAVMKIAEVISLEHYTLHGD
jgi:putative phosphoesterase